MSLSLPLILKFGNQKFYLNFYWYRERSSATILPIVKQMIT